MRHAHSLFRGVLLAVLALPAAQAASLPLPDHLSLHYVLHYGDVVVAKSVQTLQRRADGSYLHTAVTRPAGIAKLFTHVQFREQGTLRVRGTTVLPQEFTDSRSGDGRGYVRHVTFDYRHHRLLFQGRPSRPLQPGTQDLDSIFYAFMLRPVHPGMNRPILITNGKDVDPYRFVYRRSELLTTPLGPVHTYLISRLSAAEWAAEQHCGNAASPACLKPLRVFEIWVAPQLRDVAVKVMERKHGRTLTLSLEGLTKAPR